MRVKRKEAAVRLAYVEAELARPDIHPDKRAAFEGKARLYRAVLADSCRKCGRALKDPTSLADGIGPECRKALVGS